MEQLCQLIWSDDVSTYDLIYELIIKNYKVINNWNARGQTALYLSFRKANLNVAILLMHNGAQLGQLNRDGSSPITGFLWEFLNNNKQNDERYIYFNQFFSNIISTSSDRRLILDQHHNIMIETLTLNNNKKYPHISFQCIGKYYLYNDASSAIQSYHYKDEELIYHCQYELVLNYLEHDIFTLYLFSLCNQTLSIKTKPIIYHTESIINDIYDNHYMISYHVEDNIKQFINDNMMHLNTIHLFDDSVSNIKDLMTICIKNVKINFKTVHIIYPLQLDHRKDIIVAHYVGALKLVYHQGVHSKIKQIIHLSLLQNDDPNYLIKSIYILEQIYDDIYKFIEIRMPIIKNKKLMALHQKCVTHHFVN
jgi:hypothetical protein